jgi:hypothetical protein
MLKKGIALFLPLLALLVFLPLPVLACGGPLSPNDSVHLTTAQTLVGWHNGIEYYMTNFAYSGEASKFGWVLPLPAQPQKIEEGSMQIFSDLEAETLQGSSNRGRFSSGSYAANPGGAQVLQKTTIHSLTISIIQGNGSQIVNWARENGFTVDAETQAHLLMYARASSIFMAARYELPSTQQAQKQGESTPILLSMRTPSLWIPVELLATDGGQTSANFYLLTDRPLALSSWQSKLGLSPTGEDVPGAPGLTVHYREQLPDTLVQTMASETNMGWIWQHAWFTELDLSAPAALVTYDIGISPSSVIHSAAFGTPPKTLINHGLTQELPAWIPALPADSFWPVIIGLLVVLSGAAAFIFVLRRRRHSTRSAS